MGMVRFLYSSEGGGAICLAANRFAELIALKRIWRSAFADSGDTDLKNKTKHVAIFFLRGGQEHEEKSIEHYFKFLHAL